MTEAEMPHTLVKRPGVVYLSGAIATVVETSLMNTVPGYSGVIPTVVRMYEMAEERRVLVLGAADPAAQGILHGSLVELQGKHGARDGRQKHEYKSTAVSHIDKSCGISVSSAFL